MCGIVACISEKHDAGRIVFEGLKKLEYRGYDSWGIAVKKDDAIVLEKHVGKIGAARMNLPESTIAIGHTRWATHGGVTTQNAHPHTDCAGSLVVIHNGIVENHTELKAELIEKKHVFKSETDTEIIAHLVEEAYKSTDLKTAVFAVFSRLAGSNAIVVMDKKTETIVACRNGSPLVAGVDEGEYFLGSDVTAFLPHTSRAYFLDDMEGIVLTAQSATVYNLQSGDEKTAMFETIDWKVEDADKAGYPHYLLKEIMEQKKTILRAVKDNIGSLTELTNLIKDTPKKAFIGCGTAYYSCLLSRYYFANAGVDINAHPANEFAPFAQMYGADSVIIAISQSGETADTLIAVKAAKKRGTKIVAVVNARGSSLERLADLTIPVSAGPEIAVVSTKAFTAQTAALYAASRLFSTSSGEVVAELTDFSNQLTDWLTDKLQEKTMQIAKELIDTEHIYLIGKHENYPAALEAGLKIKETSYIHAESFAAGELKHGVITLIQSGTPCLVFGSNDTYQQETLSSAAELKSRGALIYGISLQNASEFDRHIGTFDAGALTPIVNCIVGQLLGYYLGVGRGADPDKPRNLAKSVTVK